MLVVDNSVVPFAALAIVLATTLAAMLAAGGTKGGRELHTQI